MPPRVTHKTRELRPTYIRDWRKHRGLSQDKLVERVREKLLTFSKSTLSGIERSERPYTQPILEAIAWALGCEPEDLIMRRPGGAIWSIVDQLHDVPEDDLKQVAQIVSTFRKAS